MSKHHLAIRSALLAGAAFFALSQSAAAQTATPTDPPKHHRHNSDADRFEILEQQIHEQAAALKEQSAEIQSLKTQLDGGAAPTKAEFTALSNKVDAQEAQIQQSPAKDQGIVAFTKQTPYQHQKTQPTIASRDGRWTFSPVVMVQGDWASYSKGQPLSTPGTDNLKASGENVRRARIGFQGTFAKDFGYSFVYDFGGSNGDETYQGYAAANSGTTTNNNGKNISPYTASTGAGTGPHIYNAWVSYKGFLDPFTFRVGVMSTPANLADTTQSDDLLFNERPTPAQLSRALDADEGRESVGFIGNGDIWNASVFMTGDTYGKGALVAPATTYAGAQEAVVGRVAVAPIQHPDSNFNVHLGANIGYVIHPQEATSTADPGVTTFPITFSDRPELRVDNVTFLNTGAINAKSAYAAGLEAAVSYGPVMIQGENFWYGVERDNPASGVSDPNFTGWYVEGSWVLTGEAHQYNIANASFVRPSPERSFDPSNGDWGAWELAGRYSSTDLDYDIDSSNSADRVFGGEQYIWSAGVNFYPTDFLKFMFDWQNVELKNIGAFGDNGRYQTFEVRSQVSF